MKIAARARVTPSASRSTASFSRSQGRSLSTSSASAKPRLNAQSTRNFSSLSNRATAKTEKSSSSKKTSSFQNASKTSYFAQLKSQFAPASLSSSSSTAEAGSSSLGSLSPLMLLALMFMSTLNADEKEKQNETKSKGPSGDKPATEFIEQAVGSTGDLKDGQMKEVKVGENKFLLSRVDGQYYFTDLGCTHFGMPLTAGILNGELVTCPLHMAEFSVKTGAPNSGPGLNRLRTYPVKIEGDQIIVKVPTKLPDYPRLGKKCCEDNRVFVIVGAGAAGATAAETLRQDGFQGKIIMITKEDYLPYDRTLITKVPNCGEKQQLRNEEFYKLNGIDILRGREVRQVDVNTKQVLFADGSDLKYDAVLLATGASPREIRVPGYELENVFTIRDLKDSQALAAAAKDAKTAVVIGSSFIGMEAAAMMKKAFKVDEVVVVGMENVPFERVLGKEVGEIAQKFHESNGVKFKMADTVKQYNGDGKVSSVDLKSGESLKADLVVVGAGVIPTTNYVKGVPLNKDGSITVDEHLKLADGAFAAGDIAQFPYKGQPIRVEHWAVGLDQGRVAAHNMLGKNVPYSVLPFFWTRSFDTSLQYAGHAQSFDEVIIQGDTSKRQFVAYYVKDGKVAAVSAMGKEKSIIAAKDLLRDDKMPKAADIKKEKVFDIVNYHTDQYSRVEPNKKADKADQSKVQHYENAKRQDEKQK